MKRQKTENQRFFWWRCHFCRIRFQNNIDDSKRIIENYYDDNGYFLCDGCKKYKK